METLVNNFTTLKAIYQNKKVLVTGHTGFKGSWLIKMLSLFDAQIKGYALAPENDFDLYHVINGDQLCDSVIADLRDRATLKKAVLDFEPDFVMDIRDWWMLEFEERSPFRNFFIERLSKLQHQRRPTNFLIRIEMSNGEDLINF